MHFLFLCTGNSCRSILSEAVFNHLAPPGFVALSAGSHPSGALNQGAVAQLRRKGIAADGLASKSWHDLALTPDVVVTVCGNAAGETCPAYLGQAVRAHWGLEDPGLATGSAQDIEAAFEQTYRIVLARTEALFALPPADLAGDRATLQRSLERIGALAA